MTVLYSIQSPEMLYILDMYPLWHLIENHFMLFKKRHLSDECHANGIFSTQPRRRDAVLVLGARF